MHVIVRALLLGLALGTAAKKNKDKKKNDTRVEKHPTEGVVVELHGQPNSGTTWLEVITDDIVTAGGGQSKKPSRRAEYGDELIGPIGKHGLPGREGAAHEVHGDIQSSYEGFLKRCVDDGIKIWSEACVPPAYLGPLPDNTRYVLILRDPRAVVVSWAHWSGKGLENGNVTESYFTETVPQCAALVSLRYYWHDELLRRTHPSLILFYEDLVANPVDEYYRLASFLDVNLEPDVMFGVVDQTSAASMRKDEEHHKLPGPNGKLPGPNGKKDHRKVRSATPDAFREEVSARALADATAAMAPLLHPALRMKWLYNDLDVKFLGLKEHQRRH